MNKSLLSFVGLGALLLTGCASSHVQPSNDSPSEPGDPQGPGAPPKGDPNNPINAMVAQAGKIDSSQSASGPVKKQDLGTQSRGNFDCRLEKYGLTTTPDEFALFNPRADVLYPGSVLQGRSMADGATDPIPVGRAAETVTLALVTGGTGSFSREVSAPSLASITQAQNDILSQYSGPTPAKFSYRADAIYSASQLAVIVDAKFQGFGAAVAANFNINESDAKSRVLIQFSQEYFTMAASPPQGAAGAFAPSVTTADLQPYVGPGNPPVYVSSVTYGRKYYLMFESTASQTDLEAAVTGSYDGGFWSLGASARAKYKSIVNGATIRTYGLGGNATDAIKAVTGHAADDPNADRHAVVLQFHDFLANNASFNKNTPGAPVSYALRYLGDSSAVRLALTTEYTAKQCTPRTEPPKMDPTYALDEASSVDTTETGSTGDIHFRDRCPSGYVATGVEGRAAPAGSPLPGVPGIRLICQRLEANGSLGAVSKTTYQNGTAGGSAFSGTCATGALRGMRGSSGSTIDHLDGRCLGITDSTSGIIGPCGGNWTDNFNLDCQPNYYVTGIFGSYGWVLGRLGLICTRVVVR